MTLPLRDRLLASAARLVERTGSPDGVTLRAVAREAGVSAPAVYGHFADLDALLDAVVDTGFVQLRDAIRAAVDRETDPVARLRAGCRAYVDAGLSAPGRYRAMFGPRRLPSGRRAFEALIEGINACVAAGRSASTDPEADATLVWTALHGVVTLRAAGPQLPWPHLDEQLTSLVTRLARLAD